jgi:hypothetical protein
MSKKGKRELGMKKEDMLAPFDTLAAYDKLKEVFTEEQARVIVRVMWFNSQHEISLQKRSAYW